jgi:hypothetical protein
LNRPLSDRPNPLPPLVLIGQGEYQHGYTPTLPRMTAGQALAMVRTESRERGEIVVNVPKAGARLRGVA